MSEHGENTEPDVIPHEAGMPADADPGDLWRSA